MGKDGPDTGVGTYAQRVGSRAGRLEPLDAHLIAKAEQPLASPMAVNGEGALGEDGLKARVDLGAEGQGALE
ncbi:hypothetical protein D3C87_1942430 [compost metagenome]